MCKPNVQTPERGLVENSANEMAKERAVKNPGGKAAEFSVALCLLNSPQIHSIQTAAALLRLESSCSVLICACTCFLIIVMLVYNLMNTLKTDGDEGHLKLMKFNYSFESFSK